MVILKAISSDWRADSTNSGDEKPLDHLTLATKKDETSINCQDHPV